jgi:cytidine deaminase
MSAEPEESGAAELHPRALELAELARAAAERAYSPYSKVCVGAALLARSGAIHTGCNVENASYGLTLCAERNAVFTAVAEGDREFEAIAIWSSLQRPLPACGACRQVLNEFAPRLRVIVAHDGGTLTERGLEELLPDAVSPADIHAARGGDASGA